MQIILLHPNFYTGWILKKKKVLESGEGGAVREGSQRVDGITKLPLLVS